MIVATSLLFATATPVTATVYEFFDLGPYSVASAINDAGQIAGRNAAHAAMWNATTVMNLGTLGGSYSEALGINASGQVVGVSMTAEGYYHAFSTGPNGVGMIDLGRGRATDINDIGQAVGNNVFSASAWNGTTLRTLSQSGWLETASAINNAGQIVGLSIIDVTAHTSVGRAIVWDNTTAMVLGGGGGTANAINNPGQIVGASAGSDGYSHATLWDGLTITDLGILPNGTQSQAHGINDIGQIVGYGDVILTNGHRKLRAILWDAGTMIDLNGLLDASIVNAGWVLSTASDINNHGAITGQAINILSGIEQAFLLSPSPEALPQSIQIPAPATYTLVLGGAFIMGLIGRRSRKGTEDVTDNCGE
jgi:probable HAF family extracellular repeat protein